MNYRHQTPKNKQTNKTNLKTITKSQMLLRRVMRSSWSAGVSEAVGRSTPGGKGFGLLCTISGTVRCDTIHNESREPRPLPALSALWVLDPRSHRQWLLWEGVCGLGSPCGTVRTRDRQLAQGQARTAAGARLGALPFAARAALHQRTSLQAEDPGRNGGACGATSTDLRGMEVLVGPWISPRGDRAHGPGIQARTGRVARACAANGAQRSWEPYSSSGDPEATPHATPIPRFLHPT